MPQTTRRITQDDIEANFVRIQKAHEETERSIKELSEDTKELRESTKELRESIVETNNRLNKSIEEASRKLNDSIEETSRKLNESLEETNKRLNESLEEASKRLDESIRRTSRKIYKSIGGIDRTIGKMSERTLVPNLLVKFKQLGFTFEIISRRRKIAGKEYDIYTEIDAFLENTTQAMAVEVKTTLRQDEVDWHVKRMDKIRRHADSHGDRRQFFGAMAATVVDDDARIYALRHGFYVIEPSGEDVTIVEPGAVRVW